MSQPISIPKTKTNGLLMAIGVLASVIVFAIPMVIKILDQKDDRLVEARSTHEQQVREINERHKENMEKLRSDLSATRDDLRAARAEIVVYGQRYEGAKERIAELERTIDQYGSAGMEPGSAKEYARLKGEAKELEMALADSRLKIEQLEQEKFQLESDLAAAKIKIAELTDSLNWTRIQLQQRDEEIRQYKGITAGSISKLEQAFIQESLGDGLPDRKRFRDEKFQYYEYSLKIMKEVRQELVNADILINSIQRLTAKLEELRPGYISESESTRGF